MKNKIIALKRTLNEYKGRFKLAEERITKLEDRTMKIIASEEPKEKKKRERPPGLGKKYQKHS